MRTDIQKKSRIFHLCAEFSNAVEAKIHADPILEKKCHDLKSSPQYESDFDGLVDSFWDILIQASKPDKLNSENSGHLIMQASFNLANFYFNRIAQKILSADEISSVIPEQLKLNKKAASILQECGAEDLASLCMQNLDNL